MLLYTVFYVKRNEVRIDHKPTTTAFEFVPCGTVRAINVHAALRAAKAEYPHLRSSVAVQRNFESVSHAPYFQ